MAAIVTILQTKPKKLRREEAAHLPLREAVAVWRVARLVEAVVAVAVAVRVERTYSLG